MSENNSGPISAILGVAEGVVGIVKQLIGIVFKEAEAEKHVPKLRFRRRAKRARASRNRAERWRDCVQPEGRR